MGRDWCRKRLKICIPNKPVKNPFQITDCVFECFRPILLLVEALCNRVAFYSVIFNPTKVGLKISRATRCE